MFLYFRVYMLMNNGKHEKEEIMRFKASKKTIMCHGLSSESSNV